MSSPMTTLPRTLVAHHRRERSPDVGDEALVDLVADQTTDVIRLDHAVHQRGGPGHGSPRKLRLLAPAYP